MAIFDKFRKKKEQPAAEPAKKPEPVADNKKAEVKSASAAKNAPTEKAQSPAKAAPAKASATAKAVPEAKPAVKKAPATSAKPATKQAPAPKTAAKPAAPAKAPAAKAAPAAKPAPAAKAVPNAVKTTSEPARPAARAAGVPFFAATEEDIRIAFDQAIADAEAEILKNGAKAVGKYEFELEVDGYHFYLIANNGQVLFDSPSFTTLLGAINGIKTFKKTVASSEFDIKVDKYNRYRFILANKYYGENYTTREQCQKCVESVRNFANNSRIIRFKPEKEALVAYETAKISKRSADDVDWNAIARAEEASPKRGKFEICQENNEFCFYLLASNGQILYSSRFYANENACRKGIESFKRAAYVGNFFVDRDKFGNYRYVLKNIGSAPSFIGESYDNKPQCEKIIESVKNFIVSASIETESEADTEA